MLSNRKKACYLPSLCPEQSIQLRVSLDITESCLQTCFEGIGCVAWRFWLCALNQRRARSTLKLIFLAASPLVLASFARVFAASPLSGAPDKTAMLCRLKEHRRGDDNFSCRFKYSCPCVSPRTSASVHRLFEALCF